MKKLAAATIGILGLFGPGMEAKEKPNIIVVMVDDLGFADLGYHGSEIATPTIDGLAAGGVKFSQFYNTGRCCPTRASFMTGIDPHETGIGHMTNPPGEKFHDHDLFGYRGEMNQQNHTIAELLKTAGYKTYMSGKWHLGEADKSLWPLQRGFDKFYGCLTGATRFFDPHEERMMTLDNEPVENVSKRDTRYYTTDAFTDYAIGFLSDHEKENDEAPFFLYLAYTAPHWPLQAFEDDIANYRGRYKAGWEKLREERFRRQKEIGLMSEDTKLSYPDSKVPAWDSLSEEEQDERDLQMAIYAAMVDRMDQNMALLVDTLKEQGEFENTLIMFLSDNGACAEGGIDGRGPFVNVEERNASDDNSYATGWAMAGNTPFSSYKHFLHEGGIATPFFAHWPEGIKPSDDWVKSPSHVLDIMPTVLELSGADYPDTKNGKPVPDLDGVSLTTAFANVDHERERPIILEHERNAALRDGKWKLVGTNLVRENDVKSTRWELYNIEEDRTEMNNLVDTHGEKIAELEAKWLEWAKASHVLPSPTQPIWRRPQVQGRAFDLSLTAEPVSGEDTGVLMAYGGKQFGFALHMVDGKPTFSIRNKGKLIEAQAEESISQRSEIFAQLTGDALKLSVDGELVAETPFAGFIETQPGFVPILGEDRGHPVAAYEVPNRFRGEVTNYDLRLEIPPSEMRTEWSAAAARGETWKEYPRPAFKRADWVNLNGLWNYAVTDHESDVPSSWEGEILVPFAYESPLSGVEGEFRPEDALWYERRFVQAPAENGDRVLLNFEAVDYECEVWLNGKSVGKNRGGNLPFSFDITNAIAADGDNLLQVRVLDATDRAYQLHGKQLLSPHGIFYTPVSGIYQTVWLETVPGDYLKSFQYQSHLSGQIDFTFEKSGDVPVEVKVFDEGKQIVSGSTESDSLSLRIPQPEYWSPDSPKLYQVELKHGDDVVESYVAIREVGKVKDADGHWRFTLNGEIVFHWGTLDQGWWPDGLLTPPSDEALKWDIVFTKEAGFNVIRKHIKVEPRRFYTHCDEIGMMVWQDQVTAFQPGKHPVWTRLTPNPERGVWPDEEHAKFRSELKGMIDTLYNHPSIVQWVPYNERWGQHNTMAVGKWVSEYDRTRHINIASGGNFFPVGDIVDEHRYPHPGFPFHENFDGRFDPFIRVVGEFGGHGIPVEGHLWDPKTKNWGYGDIPKNMKEWEERYRESLDILADLKAQGIAGGIYTQITDVEGEINGLVTYDRKKPKLTAEEFKKIAEEAELVD